MRIFLFITALFTAAALVASPGRAEDLTLDAAIALKKPRKEAPRGGGPLDKVELKIFIPDGVKFVRGAILDPFSLNAVEKAHWREAARLWGFALVSANYFGVGSWEYKETLQAALDEFSEKSKHPELKQIPFCSVGMSAGAGMCRNFALAMPDRTIAVAAVCLEAAPDTADLRRIPFLTVFGEKDGGQMKLITAKLPEMRNQGANWGIAVQWGRRHEYGQANNLVMPFFDDAIRHRFPTENPPAGMPVKLLDYPSKEAWLGEHAGWDEKIHEGRIFPIEGYKGDATTVSWFTSRRMAATWQAFVGEREKVTLIEPAGLGDMQTFKLLSPTEPVNVKAGVGSDKPERVELYDGDVKLDTKTEGPFDFQHKFAPGIHPLYVVVHVEGRKPAYSRPHTLVVTTSSK